MAGQIIDLAGQITIGLTMVVVNLVKIISNPEVFFFTDTGDLNCVTERFILV